MNRLWLRTGATTLLPSFLGAFLALGCGSAPQDKPAENAPPPRRIPLHEFLPLKDRTVSSFEVTTDLGDEGLLVLEIYRPRPELAELKIAGRVQRLTIEDNRISQATGGILLETPLEEGHSFLGSFGQVTIEKTDQFIKTPAGSFTGCLTTLEESRTPPKRARSTYCPGVGLVGMTVESFGEEGPGMVTTRLLQHGPRVEIAKKQPAPEGAR